MTGPRNQSSSGDADSAPMVVGVLSDTHGHLYPEVRESLEGVDHLIHAGDIGSPEVLVGLRSLASLTAVRGNCDFESWARQLPVVAEVEFAGARMLVGHIASRLRDRVSRVGLAGPAAAPGRTFDVVITGHTHRAEIRREEGVLYVNPGSAGPQRFGRARTVARLQISPPDGDRPQNIAAEIVAIPERSRTISAE